MGASATGLRLRNSIWLDLDCQAQFRANTQVKGAGQLLEPHRLVPVTVYPRQTWHDQYMISGSPVFTLPQGVALLDVREDDEWTAGHAPRAPAKSEISWRDVR
jgi:hypothetical protein